MAQINDDEIEDWLELKGRLLVQHSINYERNFKQRILELKILRTCKLKLSPIYGNLVN